MTRFLALPVRSPRLVILVIALLTGVFGWQATNTRLNSSIENLLPDNDPDRLFYDEVKRTFGSDEAGIIALFADDVFAPPTLAKIADVSRRIQGIDGVREVLSLATVKGVETDDFGAVSVGRLMRDVPQTLAEAEAFAKRVVANPFYSGKLVSHDRTATGIAILFDSLSDDEFIERDIEGQIRTIVGAAGGPEEFAVSGIQTLKVQGLLLMREDLWRFLPVSLLVVVIVLALAFRTVRGVLLPLSAVIAGVIWTLGLMAILGVAINLGTLVLPPLLVAVGIAYSIHLVSRYYDELAPGRPPAEVVGRALEETRLPLSVAALTTLIGFASLTLSEIPAVRDFGRFSVFGLGMIFAFTVTLVPALLVVLPEPKRGRQNYERRDLITLILRNLYRFAVRYRRSVLLGWILFGGFCLWGVKDIRVETDYLQFISPSHPVRLENDRIAERLGGTQPVYIIVDGDGADAITRLSLLAAIRDLQDFMAELPKVDGSLSVVDYLTIVRSVLNPDAPVGLPETQSEVNQLLLFVDPADLAPIVSPDRMRANVIVGTRLAGSAEIGEFVEKVEAWAKTRFRRSVEVRATGTVVLLNRSADTLAEGQIFGLVQVLVVLLIVMSVLFLSLRAGLLSLVPNIVPIVVLFGLMGWTGITLNIATSMIAGIAIGIAVDDTIFYLTTFNRLTRETGSEERAIDRAGRVVGLPIFVTCASLTAGFLVVCLSNFVPIRHFGLLASTTMIVGLAADLLLLPSLLMTAHIITVWDLLYTRLGSQPHKEIPLFSDLRPFQAKIVVLMGQLARARPGEYLTRQGELREELYVLLNGRVEVRRSEDARVIRSCGRGEVIGEMGLVRHKPRSADIVVAEETEYIVLDAAFLDRIQRRYPRIAATVFLNLTRILSDRLENTTNQLVLATKAARHHLP